jgi:hypothetical protein
MVAIDERVALPLVGGPSGTVPALAALDRGEDAVSNLMRWLLALIVCLCAAATGAQTLPFVERGGLIPAELRYSQVVARLGEPPSSRDQWMPGDPSLAGGIVFEYPAQGLGFVVPGIERPEPDPRVIYLVVRAPATALTPEGIGIGMSNAAVRALIPAGDAITQAGVLHWAGHPSAGGRPTKLHFSEARTLEVMVFDTGLPPAGALAEMVKTARVGLAIFLVIAWLMAMPWLLKGLVQRERDRLRTLAPRHRAIGTSLLVLAPVVTVLGAAVVAVSDGSVRLLGLLMLVGGGGLVLAGAYNRLLAAGLKLRWLVVAMLLFLAVLMALNALLR